MDVRRRVRVAATSPWLPFVVFLVVFGVKAVAGGDAPAEVRETYSPWLTWAWAASYVLGGVAALLGCLAERIYAEAAGLATLVFGLLLYIGAEGDDYFVALLFTLMCGSRLYWLRDARRAQRKLLDIRARDHA